MNPVIVMYIVGIPLTALAYWLLSISTHGQRVVAIWVVLTFAIASFLLSGPTREEQRQNRLSHQRAEQYRRNRLDGGRASGAPTRP